MKRLIFRRKRHRRQKAGMTMLEMVVVIAIISLLAAMLLPAVGKAMVRAKRTVCQNNEHQIYLLLLAQASDNDNRIPSAAPIHLARTIPVLDPIRIIEANITNSASQKLLLCPGDKRIYPSGLKDLSYYWNRNSLGRRFDEILPNSRLASEKWFWHETSQITPHRSPNYLGHATTLKGDGSTNFEKVPLPLLKDQRNN